MGRLIVQNKNHFNLYCTTSDNFVFVSYLTKEQLIEYMTKTQNGRDLDNRINRAEEKGTSSLIDSNLEETLLCNRCGENEAFVPIDECIKKYL